MSKFKTSVVSFFILADFETYQFKHHLQKQWKPASFIVYYDRYRRRKFKFRTLIERLITLNSCGGTIIYISVFIL